MCDSENAIIKLTTCSRFSTRVKRRQWAVKLAVASEIVWNSRTPCVGGWRRVNNEALVCEIHAKWVELQRVPSGATGGVDYRVVMYGRVRTAASRREVSDVIGRQSTSLWLSRLARSADAAASWTQFIHGHLDNGDAPICWCGVSHVPPLGGDREEQGSAPVPYTPLSLLSSHPPHSSLFLPLLIPYPLPPARVMPSVVHWNAD